MYSRHTHPNEYNIWIQLRNRCSNPKNYSYKRYGGRGIRVDPRWDSFDTFLTDMGPRPSLKHTIDRLDNSSGYSGENCCWATYAQQSRNKRTNIYVTLGGETRVIMDWCEDFGLTPRTVYLRIQRGYTPEAALYFPVSYDRRGPVAKLEAAWWSMPEWFRAAYGR